MFATGTSFLPRAATLVLSALCLAPCRGEEPDATFDRIWSNTSLCKNAGNPCLQIMPWHDLTDWWRLVFRYLFVGSSDDNRVRLSRYESRIERGKIDRAHEWFLGLNWFIHEHKLKWQNGVEYS